MILHLLSEFRVDRPIRRRDIVKNDFQYGVRPPSWIWKISIFLSAFHARNRNLYLYTKFARNRKIRGWDMEIKLFSKWRPSAILNFRKLKFWSRNLYWHAILYFRSEFRINRSIWRRDIAQKTIFNMASVRHLEFAKFRLFVKCPSWELKRTSAWQIWSKSDNSRLIYGDNAIFKMAAVRHLEFAKIAVLVTWPISACDPSSLFKISRWSGNMAPRYSQKMIFNMASVRHLGFVMTSSYCIQKLHFTFPTLC